MDFLIETRQGKVLLVDVKSDKDYKLHTALNNLIGTAEYGIEETVVLSEANVGRRRRARGCQHILERIAPKSPDSLTLFSAHLVMGVMP